MSSFDFEEAVLITSDVDEVQQEILHSLIDDSVDITYAPLLEDVIFDKSRPLNDRVKILGDLLNKGHNDINEAVSFFKRIIDEVPRSEAATILEEPFSTEESKSFFIKGKELTK